MDRNEFYTKYEQALNDKSDIDMDKFAELQRICISHDNKYFIFEDEAIQGETSLVIAMEELSELQKEISKVIRGKGDRINILEELADVNIVIERTKLLLSISDDELNAACKVKINRLEDRMKQEEEEMKAKLSDDTPGTMGG